MPVPLPVKTLANSRAARRSITPYDISSVLAGAAAVSLASFVYWAGHDQSGAALILLSAAGILALFMHGISRAKHD